MFIFIGIVLPIVLFLVTLPLKSMLFMYENVLKQHMTKGSGVENVANITNKVGKMGVEALKLYIYALKALILFIRTIIQFLMVIASVSVVLLVAVCLMLIVAVSGVVLFLNSESSTVTYSNIVVSGGTSSDTSSGGNIVDSNVVNTGWVGSIEGMAKWYLENVTTYQTTTTNSSTGKRKWYECELVGGKKVGDDCTGFSYACLVYGGYISGNPTSAPSSTSYTGNGATVPILEAAGFKHDVTSNATSFMAGDILARSGHVELVVGVNDDGTYQTFGWGKIQSKYPSTSSIGFEKLKKSYTDYFRLSK